MAHFRAKLVCFVRLQEAGHLLKTENLSSKDGNVSIGIDGGAFFEEICDGLRGIESDDIHARSCVVDQWTYIEM